MPTPYLIEPMKLFVMKQQIMVKWCVVRDRYSYHYRGIDRVFDFAGRQKKQTRWFEALGLAEQREWLIDMMVNCSKLYENWIEEATHPFALRLIKVVNTEKEGVIHYLKGFQHLGAKT